MYIMGVVIEPHHLHEMLLYSHQHLLPTRSALHHGDPPDMPHTMELHCPKESNTLFIHTCVCLQMYTIYVWMGKRCSVAVVVHEEG